MSGRGNSGAWNGKNKWKQQDGSAKKDQEQQEKVKEPFVLPGSPGTTIFYLWLDCLFAWAAEAVSQWKWHRVLDRLNPGARPEAVEPDVPDPDDYETNKEYGTAEKVYLNRMNRYDKAVEEIEQQKVLLYNKMKNNCSTKVLRELEERHEMEAYEDEDPVILLNALKVTCLGKQHGQIGNVIDSGKQFKRFIAVSQRHGQTVQDFYDYFNNEFDALVESYILSGRKKDDIMRDEWPEEKRIKHFVSSLSDRQVGDWLADIKFDAHQLPDTLDEVFKRACLEAKKSAEKYKREHNGAEYMGIFVTRDGRNNNGGRSGGRGGRGNNGGRGGGSGRGGGRQHKRQPVFDTENRRMCFDFLDNNCSYQADKWNGGQCNWSHGTLKKQESTTGKGPAVDQDVNNAILKSGGRGKGTVAFAKANEGKEES